MHRARMKTLLFSVVFALFAGCVPCTGVPVSAAEASAAAEGSGITGKEDLNRPDRRVGISVGSSSMGIAQRELPKAEFVYFDENSTAYEAVAMGKIDAYIFERSQLEYAIRSGRRGVHLLEEDLDERVRIAVGISPASGIPDLTDSLNTFIAALKADGTLDDMYKRWVYERRENMPEITPAADPQLHLTVGTSGIVPPFSYYAGTELAGLDIELAYRFAAWLGADVSFKVYDYGALISAAATGDVDCIIADLNITAERAEVLPFSDVLFEEPVGILVRGEPEAVPGSGEISSTLRKLGIRRIGVQTGTYYDELMLSVLPDAEISYFNTITDMAAAVEARKIDAFPCDEPVLRLLAAENDKIAILDGSLEDFEFGYVIPKTEEGDRLREEINRWLGSVRADGRMEKLLEKWIEGPEEERTLPDIASFPAPKGTLRFVTEGLYPPMDYFRGDELVGIEIDLTAQFCEENGYGLSMEAMNFDGILPAIQTGKADLAASAISITEERRESVNFSDPYYISGTVLAVLKSEEAPAAGGSFLEGIRGSFDKTFLRENRWRLFAQGILNTLIITLLSILTGTALGFGVFMLCRNGNPLANAITRFSVWLVQGMPMVVLLMILYYLIFGNTSLSGILVAVIGFTLTFGSSVLGLLKMGVGAVDSGQYEAAYALGYSNTRTFFRIILPQALPHVMSAYRGEIVGLIKATAIVGYIAVQDLTKMGDIVRSRTYEAFFPLIAVAVIYFVLEGGIGALIGRAESGLDPKRRRREDILKGVRTDDQD